MINIENPTKLIAQLQDVARQAGAKIMEVYHASAETSFKNKADGSPVTVADEAAEAVILPALKMLAPEITIISEENAASHNLTPPDQFFLVDPLDGTKEFLRRDGLGSFTVNIALVEHGAPVLGVVFAPALNRMFSGIVGQGATETTADNMRSISIRPVPATGAIAVASRSHRDAETNQWLEDNGIVDTISTGSSLKFCLVACGDADVYPRFGPTMEWDTAAGDAVLRAAGGKVTNPAGDLFQYAKKDYRNSAFVAHGGL